MILVESSRLISPPKLQPGDTIGVVSLSSPLYGEKLAAWHHGISFLSNKGFQVLTGPHCLDQHGYLAGPDEMRLNDLVHMMRNPHVKALFLSRGGYGSARLLPKIDFELFSSHPKIIMGYSDFTALSLALLTKARLMTYSGPMLAGEIGDNFDPRSEEWMWAALTSHQSLTMDPSMMGYRPNIFHHGIATGRLLCGTLSVICSLLGTEFAPDFENAILVLEEVGEHVYKVDRYFSQLKLAKVFNKISGLVLGQLSRCDVDDHGIPSLSLEQMLHDYIGPLAIPVMGNFPYGHEKAKFTLPVGAECELDCDNGVIRIFQSGAENA